MKVFYNHWIIVCLFFLPIKGMQLPQEIMLQGMENTITIGREEACVSPVIKDMLTDTKGNEIKLCVPFLDKILPFIKPYFKWAQENNVEAIRTTLKEQAPENLALFINAFNFFDVRLVRNESLVVLAAHIMQQTDHQKLDENSSGNFQLPHEMKRLLVQNMLRAKPEIESYVHKKYRKYKNLPSLDVYPLPNSLKDSVAVFNKDGSKIALTDRDAEVKNIKIFDVDTQEQIQQIECPMIGHRERKICFSPDGQSLATAAQGNTVKLWDIETGKLHTTFEGHTDDINALDFSPDGLQLVSACDDGTMKIWSIKEKKQTAHVQHLTQKVRWNPDGTQLAASDNSDKVQLWDCKKLSTVQYTLGSKHHVGEDIAFHPTGSLLACGGLTKGPSLWNPKTGELINQLWAGRDIEHSDYVTALSFSHDGKTLVSGAADNSLTCWDIKNNDGWKKAEFALQMRSIACYSLPRLISVNPRGFFAVSYWNIPAKILSAQVPELSLWFKSKITPEQVGLLNYTLQKKRDKNSSAVSRKAMKDSLSAQLQEIFKGNLK